jgi:hypothetical protein
MTFCIFLLASDGVSSQKQGIMGRGRKSKTIKMKNRKRQAAKKERAKRRTQAVRKARLA